MHSLMCQQSHRSDQQAVLRRQERSINTPVTPRHTHTQTGAYSATRNIIHQNAKKIYIYMYFFKTLFTWKHSETFPPVPSITKRKSHFPLPHFKQTPSGFVCIAHIPLGKKSTPSLLAQRKYFNKDHSNK